MNKIFERIMYSAFFILVASLIVSSFFPGELAIKYFYRAIWFIALLGIAGIGLAFNIYSFFRKRNFSFGVTYLGILLVLLGGLVAHLFGEEGFIEIKEGQKVNGYWIEDDIFRPVDFSIYLKDFSVEFYPDKRKGMRFVKSYKSEVILYKDGKAVKEGIIEVNKPFNFRGMSFYQYGYDAERPHQTILQVVKDPGLPLVYTGYFILLLGMVFSFKKMFFRV